MVRAFARACQLHVLGRRHNCTCSGAGTGAHVLPTAATTTTTTHHAPPPPPLTHPQPPPPHLHPHPHPHPHQHSAGCTCSTSQRGVSVQRRLDNSARAGSEHSLSIEQRRQGRHPSRRGRAMAAVRLRCDHWLGGLAAARAPVVVECGGCSRGRGSPPRTPRRIARPQEGPRPTPRPRGRIPLDAKGMALSASAG